MQSTNLEKLAQRVQDLEERLSQQEKTIAILKRSECLMKTMLQGFPVPTFIIDQNHLVIFWNKALEDMSGLKKEDTIGTRKHWRAFYETERPCMADLMIDEFIEEIALWYSCGMYRKRFFLDDAYEVIDFFPCLGTVGKWMRITAALLRDSDENLIGAIETLEDVTDYKLAEEALRESEHRYRRLSITDSLTKLYNSRHFYNQLKSEIARSNRYKRALSILLLDIDNFKAYNDTYGHPEGDEVLVQLGKIMRSCLRKTDSAYRFGGEEFTIIMPDTDGEAALALAERIRHEFHNVIFMPLPDEKVRKTVSIGVAQYVPGEEASRFIKRTDQNMYRAKQNGKNRVYYRGNDRTVE